MHAEGWSTLDWLPQQNFECIHVALRMVKCNKLQKGTDMSFLLHVPLQAVSVAQKLPGPKGSGGYNPDGSFRTTLQSALKVSNSMSAQSSSRWDCW
jgi:hypothetical protein